MTRPRVLIVEDDSTIAEHLRNALAELNFAAAGSVNTGEAAIIKAVETRPDIVLMDIMLSGDMDGIDAAQAIRSQLAIPVIYLTAHSGDETLERAKLSEPFGYLLKPFRKQQLRIAIETALHRHRLEARVKESEEKLDGIIRSVTDHMVMVNEDLEVVWANHVATDLFGKDLVGGKCHSAIRGSDRACEPCHVRETFADGGTHQHEMEVEARDGRNIAMWCTSSVAERHPDGRPKTVVEVCRDITDRKRAEQALRESHSEQERLVRERTKELSETNERLLQEITERIAAEKAARESERLFRAIFESALDCIFIKDRSLRYVLVNPVMESLLETPEAGIVGRTDRDLFGEQVGEHLMEVEARVLEGQLVEQEHTRPVDGVDRTFHDIRVPLRGTDGSIVGICGISRDITDRRTKVRLPRTAIEDYPSKAMQITLAKSRRVAATDSIVLLLGESGSGKDYLARWIHDHSPRASGPFFTVNCAGVPADLAEAELFGYEAGAFTGARARQRGLLELAEGGTLLLNEIGELPVALQAKLLTFLDTRSLTRVGGRKTIKVSARLIAATNRDLVRAVSDGSFRADLFYRLDVFSIRVPALRERIEDLPALIDRIVSRLTEELQLGSVPEIDARTLRRLGQYQWPGNVRELRNVLERGLILTGGSAWNLESLMTEDPEEGDWVWSVPFPPKPSLTDAITEMRSKFVQEALRACGGNQYQAAALLGISRFALIRLMKKHESDDRES
ncbi:MAG: sigma 54-interacting transcriptional regulator [Thermodesulfobacteriota bacterium]